MSLSSSIDVANLAGTMALGRRVAEFLFPGAVIALIGELGAGKTHLVRAAAEGLGIADSRVVNSPTFVLIQEYQARLPIYHFDAYRLKSVAEFRDLGVHEYFEGDGVCFIEWADKVEDCLPSDMLRITIEIVDNQARHVTLAATGARHEPLLGSLDSFAHS